MLPKLKAEADARQNSTLAAKKLTVDTHRGDFYQFCYFLRKTEPHSVLIKKRVFSAAPPSNKRKLARNPKPSKNKKKKQSTRAQEHDSDSEDSPNEIELEIEEEEEKPKPIMNLKYKGFNIYNHSLCIVVEPWPPLDPSKMRAVSVAPSTSRAPSIAPPDYRQSGTSSGGMRARTPLFLPDDDDDEIDDTMPINPLAPRALPPVPLFHETPEQAARRDEGPYGMMELSQVLSSAGDLRSGAVEEEEEEDNAIFFADADEVREFQ